MSFNTQNRKIDYIQNKQIANESEINLQISENQFIVQNVGDTDKKNNVLSVLREIETEWTLMEVTGALVESPSTVDQALGLSIEIDEVPENFISFIKPEIVYRNVTNTGDTTVFFNNLYPPGKGYYKEIEELPSGRYRVTVYASLRFVAFFFDEIVNKEMEAKLKVSILNPYTF